MSPARKFALLITVVVWLEVCFDVSLSWDPYHPLNTYNWYNWWDYHHLYHAEQGQSGANSNPGRGLTGEESPPFEQTPENTRFPGFDDHLNHSMLTRMYLLEEDFDDYGMEYVSGRFPWDHPAPVPFQNVNPNWKYSISYSRDNRTDDSTLEDKSANKWKSWFLTCRDDDSMSWKWGEDVNPNCENKMLLDASGIFRGSFANDTWYEHASKLVLEKRGPLLWYDPGNTQKWENYTVEMEFFSFGSTNAYSASLEPAGKIGEREGKKVNGYFSLNWKLHDPRHYYSFPMGDAWFHEFGIATSNPRLPRYDWQTTLKYPLPLSTTGSPLQETNETLLGTLTYRLPEGDENGYLDPIETDLYGAATRRVIQLRRSSQYLNASNFNYYQYSLLTPREEFHRSVTGPIKVSNHEWVKHVLDNYGDEARMFQRTKYYDFLPVEVWNTTKFNNSKSNWDPGSNYSFKNYTSYSFPTDKIQGGTIGFMTNKYSYAVDNVIVWSPLDELPGMNAADTHLSGSVELALGNRACYEIKVNESLVGLPLHMTTTAGATFTNSIEMKVRREALPSKKVFDTRHRTLTTVAHLTTVTNCTSYVVSIGNTSPDTFNVSYDFVVYSAAPLNMSHAERNVSIPVGTWKYYSVDVISPSYNVRAVVSPVKYSSPPNASVDYLVVVGRREAYPSYEEGQYDALTATSTENGDYVLTLDTPTPEIGDTYYVGVFAPHDVSGDSSGVGRDLWVDVFADPSPPIVASLSYTSLPTSGGGRVNISGDGFSLGYGNDLYKVDTAFGNCTDLVEDPQTNSLSCAVPEGHGEAWVSVSRRSLSGPRATFMYDAPIITDVYPRSGNTNGSTVITLSGSNFGFDSRSVFVGGKSCEEITDYENDVDLHSTIKCVTPQGTGIRKEIVVDIAGQNDTFGTHFKYDPPYVTGVEPPTGPTAGGSLITVTGRNFGTLGGFIYLDRYDCDATCAECSWSETTVVCEKDLSHTKDIQGSLVTALVDSQKGGSEAYYQYDPPVVDAAHPFSTPWSGGITLTVTGSNFGFEATVTVQGKACVVSFANDTVVECTLPPVSGIDERVVRVTSGALSGNRTLPVSYILPHVSEVSPSEGPALVSSTVTITGNMFGSGEASSVTGKVLIGGKECTPVVSYSDEEIVCHTPVDLAGSHEVLVSVPKGVGTTDADFIFTAPVVSEVSPAVVSTQGGEVITIQVSCVLCLP